MQETGRHGGDTKRIIPFLLIKTKKGRRLMRQTLYRIRSYFFIRSNPFTVRKISNRTAA